MAKKSTKCPADVAAFTHEGDKRKNIPTAEYQSVLQKEQEAPRTVRYPRNTDLDPQLVWRGKDEQDWSDLVTQAPPLYIQEKVHPKVLVDDLLRQSADHRAQATGHQTNLFADFNGIAEGADKTEFYQHDQNWTNRMILGDSLQVMASFAEREGLRGRVQCIYLDPPYGIKFNSNFQWSTTSRDVKDGNVGHITREPEQVKAFRDTWRDGIHSYLTYLRDRLTVARDLLTESGSIFVQIGDENVHRVRALMDEVFGEENHVSDIVFRKKTMPFGANFLEQMSDTIVWFAKKKSDTMGRRNAKYRQIRRDLSSEPDANFRFASMPDGSVMELSVDQRSNWRGQGDLFRLKSMEPSGPMESGRFNPIVFGHKYEHPRNGYAVNEEGMARLVRADRVAPLGRYLNYILFKRDTGNLSSLTNPWYDTVGPSDKQYVVQTANEVVKRCILMTTDPGDLVLDPTCGSGTTAYVAEQWGRRWITIDTSRVALALARARIMGARYPYYLLADSEEGKEKEAEVTQTAPSSRPVRGDLRQGFVYERVPHITLKSIANNTEIDVIWERHEETLAPLRAQLSAAAGQKKPLEEWEIPREKPANWPPATQPLLTAFWEARIARQKAIDASIAAKADFEYLYDKPYTDKSRVRVAGPFTVESLSPHRMLGVDENGDLLDAARETADTYGAKQSFPQMILENLRMAGVQQAHREDRITFTSLTPWPGDLVCGEGRFSSDQWSVVGGQSRATDHQPLPTTEKRAAIFIGPEFGTVQRADLVAAAREAGDAGFDVLIACAFNYEAHTTEFGKLGRLPVLKARMNADLHMAADLKSTGKGNLFVIFGEPDIDLLTEKDGRLRVRVRGVDVFKPQTGEVVSDNADGIACWFLDTDYNEESFFVRHAYFLGQIDPYSALKTTLKAEINEEAWESLHSDTSRPFDPPKSGRIAVKVINHLGDEVMKVFRAGS